MNAVLIRTGAIMACDPHGDLSALLPRLVAFARTIVGDREVARDLVQEAAARALGATQVPAEAPAYRAWMFRIVRNAALDELRRRRRQEPVLRSGSDIDLFGFDAARIAKLTVERGFWRAKKASDKRCRFGLYCPPLCQRTMNTRNICRYAMLCHAIKLIKQYAT